jgi:hypothetical protein
MPVPTSAVSAEHRDLDLRLVSGEWPADIRGDAVFSAPQVARDLPFALFGFGVVCRLSLQPGRHGSAEDRFAWRHNVLDTPSQRLHAAAPETFTAGPTGYLSPFGFPNCANTAPLPWDGRLFATWDVGRPVEIDPVDLTFRGDVGSQASWGTPTLPGASVLPFFFSTAHPVVDPERQCLWTVKQSFTMDGGTQLHVVYWDGLGTEVRVWPITNGVVYGSAHTVSQTRDFLVLADSGNFKADPGEMAGGPRTATIDDDAAVYLVRKDQLLVSASCTPHEGQPFRVAPTTGHFYARWDDADGVRVLFEHMDRMDLGQRLRADDLDALGRPIDPGLVGFYNTAMAPSTISEVLFDPATGVSKQEAAFRDDWTWNLELSAMDWSVEALTNPVLHHVAYQGYRPGAVSRRAVELYGDRLGPSRTSGARSTSTPGGSSGTSATTSPRPRSRPASTIPGAATTAGSCCRSCPTTGSGSNCSTPPTWVAAPSPCSRRPTGSACRCSCTRPGCGTTTHRSTPSDSASATTSPRRRSMRSAPSSPPSSTGWPTISTPR